MDRIVGIEIEYGCLATGDLAASWPTRVKNHVFAEEKRGLIDQHYRDYEEPPGNGGFLFNGSRLYLDMGHLEYATAECLSLRDLVAHEIAGDQLILDSLMELKPAESEGNVSFLKNNIDHFTDATFGCHENYLMRRDAIFSEGMLGSLLAFLSTRQIFTGSGRIGSASPQFYTSLGEPLVFPRFQMSQRADHMVNDVYQWVQFNRSIINARDEPLADPRKFRRLHLLIGDSNMSPYAIALKCGTTALVLRLLEEQALPKLALRDAVLTTQALSRDVAGDWLVSLENDSSCSAIDLQFEFLRAAKTRHAGEDDETDWVLAQWEFVLANLRSHPDRLLGGVDWLTKHWLLELFAESENLPFGDPWMLSQDLEYHNIDPTRGLFFSVEAAGEIRAFNDAARVASAVLEPPANTRAAGRSAAMREIQKRDLDYFLNWDGVALDEQCALRMPDPFQTYTAEAAVFLSGVASLSKIEKPRRDSRP